MDKKKRNTVIILSLVAFVLIAVVILIVCLSTCNKNDETPNEPIDFSLSNPVIYADAPDPDVIRVGNSYYMVSTTMHLSPGCPIMKSTDLVNWKIINYAYDVLGDNDKLALRNGENAYAGGTWAASLRYAGGYFYVAVMSFTTGKSYIYSTSDIENGNWTASVFDRIFYDCSLLFDDDGSIYVVSCGGGSFYVSELEIDTGYTQGRKLKLKDGGMLDKKIIDKSEFADIPTNVSPEGAHIYKLNGKYYLFSICWSDAGRVELCHISDRIDGKYTGGIVFSDKGIAQGGIFDTPDGKWYSMLFRDSGAVGRIPYLVPVTWNGETPVFGKNGKVDESATIRVNFENTDIFCSDEFDNLSTNYFEKRFNMGGYTTAISGIDPDFMNATAGQELVGNNNNWQTTEKGWWVDGNADISVSNDIVTVADRVDRGEGARLSLLGLKQGYTYKFSFEVVYGESGAAKDNKYFKLGLTDGDGKYYETATVTAQKGVWIKTEKNFTIPVDFDYENAYISVHSNFWDDEEVPDGQPALGHIADFSFKNVKVTQVAVDGEYYRNGEYDYNGSNLGLQWQFSHNPDNRNWSLTERDGYLRLRSGKIVENILNARNILTQRTFGTQCSAYTKIDFSHLNDGDFCGIMALQYIYGFASVTKENGKTYLVMYNTFGSGDNFVTFEEERIEIRGNEIYLKLDFSFAEGKERAYFYYGTDGENFKQVGSALHLQYSLEHFVGYRFGLFMYSTKQIGGYADFDFFRISDKIFNIDEA